MNELKSRGKRITGFSWTEDVLAGVARQMPYNAEAEKHLGSDYRKAIVPFVSKVEADDRLVTGQNPFSAHATARKVVSIL